MKLTIHPGKPLRGEVTLPGDKSISHRAVLFASLSSGQSVIEHFLVSGVTQAMVTALRQLGVEIEQQADTLSVHGKGLQAAWSCHPENQVIDCENSATTMRLLAGGLAAAGARVILDGSDGLRRRPMQRIVHPLQSMGVDISADQGCAPLRLGRSVRPLIALDYHLPVASAQVKSCLLLAGLVADQPSTLYEPGPSRDHTERMLQKMGVEIICARNPGQPVDPFITRLVPPREELKPVSIKIPGDFSAAAFLIVAGLITPDSELLLKGVGLNPTRTGLLDALIAMGADIQVLNTTEAGGEPAGDLRVRHSALRGTHIAGDLVVRMIDEFPVFAVAAAYADGQTIVCDASELRHKESDRIAALCHELSSLGVDILENEDGFVIQGSRSLQGGTARAHGDHRLAMSLAVLGLAARNPVSIPGSQIIGESFPEFALSLEKLGAELQEEVEFEGETSA